MATSWPEGDDFNEELFSLTKPSSSKILSVAEHALTLHRHYKNIVHSLEKFVRKSTRDTRLVALFVIDAIIRRSRAQFGEKKDMFAPRLSNNMMLTFAKLVEVRSFELPKVEKILQHWRAKNYFTSELLEEMDAIYHSQVEHAATHPDEDEEEAEEEERRGRDREKERDRERDRTRADSPVAPTGERSPRRDEQKHSQPYGHHAAPQPNSYLPPPSSSNNAAAAAVRDPRRAAQIAAAAAHHQHHQQPHSLPPPSQGAYFPPPVAAAPPPPPVPAPAPVLDTSWDYDEEDDEEEDEEARKEKLRKKLEDEKRRMEGMAAAATAQPVPQALVSPTAAHFPPPPSSMPMPQPIPPQQQQPPQMGSMPPMQMSMPMPPQPLQQLQQNSYPQPSYPQPPLPQNSYPQPPPPQPYSSAPIPQASDNYYPPPPSNDYGNSSLPPPQQQPPPSMYNGGGSYERQRDPEDMRRQDRGDRRRSRSRSPPREYGVSGGGPPAQSGAYQQQRPGGGEYRGNGTRGGPGGASGEKNMLGFVILTAPHQTEQGQVKILSTTLLITHANLNELGMDFNAMRSYLQELIRPYGQCDSIMTKDNLSFIRFRTRASAARAKRNMEGQPIHGKPARIGWAKPKEVEKENFQMNWGEGLLSASSPSLSQAQTEEINMEDDPDFREKRIGRAGNNSLRYERNTNSNANYGSHQQQQQQGGVVSDANPHGRPAPSHSNYPQQSPPMQRGPPLNQQQQQQPQPPYQPQNAYGNLPPSNQPGYGAPLGAPLGGGAPLPPPPPPPQQGYPYPQPNAAPNDKPWLQQQQPRY